jgi:hypothetical protein
VAFEGATSVDITFINPNGPDVQYLDQPLSGTVLWPGANEDPDDWPGWIFKDGLWFEGDDGFLWVRPTVDVLFQVNPEVTLEVSYPSASEICADPENPEVEGTEVENTEVTLPFTGTDAGTTGLLAVALLGVGALILVGAKTAGSRD